eukprot:scaffold220267_cov22-Tisochrysis_lutea.AAC.1
MAPSASLTDDACMRRSGSMGAPIIAAMRANEEARGSFGALLKVGRALGGADTLVEDGQPVRGRRDGRHAVWGEGGRREGERTVDGRGRAEREEERGREERKQGEG